MISLVVYVPDSHLEQVKQAMFKAGAGRIGNYDSCSWQTKGMGQFRPLPGSDPYQGQTGNLEQVDEWKVEMICPAESLHAVIEALRAAHPYETPAFSAIETLTP